MQHNFISDLPAQMRRAYLYPENHSLGEWFKRGCCR